MAERPNLNSNVSFGGRSGTTAWRPRNWIADIPMRRRRLPEPTKVGRYFICDERPLLTQTAVNRWSRVTRMYTSLLPTIPTNQRDRLAHPRFRHQLAEPGSIGCRMKPGKLTMLALSPNVALTASYVSDVETRTCCPFCADCDAERRNSKRLNDSTSCWSGSSKITSPG